MAQAASSKEAPLPCLWENNVLPVEQQLIPSEENDLVTFAFDELGLNDTNVIKLAPEIHWCEGTATYDNFPVVSCHCRHQRNASHTSSYRSSYIIVNA
jgi:hypothetical protein